jgi:hypothetical protein
MCISKETYMYIKRDLYVYQKRPICISKETYMYIKRDLYVYQKSHSASLACLLSDPIGPKKKKFSKVLTVVALYSVYTRVLTFENSCLLPYLLRVLAAFMRELVN